MIRISRKPPVLALLVIALLMAGCSSHPALQSDGFNETPTPQAVSADFILYRGKAFIWGGILIGKKIDGEEITLEVLSYPLDSKQRPDRQSAPTGRFYIDGTDVAHEKTFVIGKPVTATGILTDMRKVQVGEDQTNFPLLTADNIHPWTKNRFFQPGISVGFGFFYSN